MSESTQTTSLAKYIVIDGIDGGGKTTLFSTLKEAFTFPDFVFTREPGGTDVGEKLRSIVLQDQMSPLAEFWLFLAQRKEVRDQVVTPNLTKKSCVISDRSDSSTFAYQIRGRNLPYLEEQFWESRKTIAPLPSLYIFLDLDPEVAAKRLGKRESGGQSGDRFDSQSSIFFDRVRKGFVEFAQKVGTPCIFVDATLSQQELSEKVITHIKKHLLASVD